eukprot:CAMPEP_0184014822 /NCGR_PEP_ID=MMETSP0954-20121128/5926_1 /TAXON_ID=627963 /ORGANISM="Aplanochytrium sp, Strain PBS07" /LENGTH=228 /DNA_ID=CAMNT_0026295453 /DNA_START=259 /DNA_END=945 /DNA_ORIENTATION=-
MTTLYVVRHGETDWNRKHIMQGQTDIELNEHGLKQAASCHLYFESIEGINRVYTSDLSRAKQTGEILAKEKAIPVATDSRLRELSLGCFEGHTYADIKKIYPVEFSNWRSVTGYKVPEGKHGRKGENQEEFKSRIISVFSDLAKAHMGESIVVVCHGGVLREMVSSLMGIYNVKFTNASVTKITASYQDGETDMNDDRQGICWEADTLAEAWHVEKVGFVTNVRSNEV